ncbi:hypothetical protein GW17_00021825 [Ensete ventricosum]|nr:hypothetical protein GW17_00021825 [Ensete ventricosum]
MASNRAYFGLSNKDFYVTFPKSSRHIRLSSNQGLRKKHCPDPTIKELRSTSVDKLMIRSSPEEHGSVWLCTSAQGKPEIPVQYRHDIQELQRRADRKDHAPEEVFCPEAQDADDSEIGGEDMDRHLHHLAGSDTQQRQPRPRQQHAGAASHPVERPIRLRELRRIGLLQVLDKRSLAEVGRASEIGEAIDVEPVGAVEAIDPEESERKPENEEVEEEDAEPEDVPPMPARLPRRGGCRRRQRRVAVLSVLRGTKEP